MLRLVSALLLTLALLIGTVWGLKILWEKRGWEGTDQGDRPIKILSTAYLAPRKSVYLVEVGRRILVVGSGNGEVAALDVITDPEEVEQIRQAARAAVGGFPEVLKKVWNRQETGRSHEEARRLAEESRETIGGFVEKVRNLSPKSKSGPKAGGGEE